MIASYGGAEIDKFGNREFKGSGGMVGGLSAPGKNYAYILGAGPEYHSFTPARPENEPYYDFPIDPPGGGGPVDNPIDPPIGGGPVDPPGGGGPVDNPIGSGPGTGTGTPTTTTTTVIPQTVYNLIDRILGGVTGATGTARNDGNPIFLFTPQQPVAGQTGGNSMRIIVLLAVAAAAWFAYKKWVA